MIISNKKEDLNISLRKQKIASYILKQLYEVNFIDQTTKAFVSDGRDAKTENIVKELDFDSDEALIEWIVRQNEVTDICFYFFILKESLNLELCITPLIRRVSREAANKNVYALAILEFFTTLHSDISPLLSDRDLVAFLLKGEGKTEGEAYFSTKILIAMLRFSGFNTLFAKEIAEKVNLTELFVVQMLGSRVKSMVELGIEGITLLFDSSYFSETIIKAIDSVMSRNTADLLLYQVFDTVPKEKIKVGFTYLLEKYGTNALLQGLDTNRLKLPAIKLVRSFSALPLNKIASLDIEQLLNSLLKALNRVILEPKTEENNQFLVDFAVSVGNIVEEVDNYELHCEISETLLSYVELTSSNKVVEEIVWCVETVLAAVFYSADKTKLNERLLNCGAAQVLASQLHSDNPPTMISALNGLVCLARGSGKTNSSRVLAILDADLLEALTLNANESISELAAMLLESVNDLE